MIGFIKKLISGILSFLFGLLKGKKSQEIQPESKPAELPGKVTGKTRGRSGFYLELNETEDDKSIAEQLSAATNGAKTALATATAKATDSVKTAINTVTDTQPVKAEADKSKATANNQSKTPATANNQSKTPATTNNQSKTPATANNQSATSATANKKPVDVELVQTAEGLKAEPAKPKKGSVVSNGQAQTETTFAPKYLIPTNSNSRRRPGPNMSTFLDMARQVKPSS